MKIVFHGANASAFESGFATLLGGTHEIACLPDALTAAADIAAFRDADVAVGIALNTQHPRPEKLRLYHVPGAGYDGIDRTCMPVGAHLCNCFGHDPAIAEYVMTALLLRHVPLPAADRDLRQGKWTYWAGAPGALRTELGSRSIGFLGFGHIGKAIAGKAKAFGMRVTVANRAAVATGPLVDQSFGLDRLREFMGSADYIVSSLPFLPATKGLVDARALAAMRPDGVIVNVGRGPVIDEAALYAALQDKRIGGAIIDTWYVYPSAANPMPHPGNWPFHALDNCMLTPHMSGWTEGTVRRRQQTMADNVLRLARGEQLKNVV